MRVRITFMLERENYFTLMNQSVEDVAALFDQETGIYALGFDAHGLTILPEIIKQVIVTT